jgi:hypothetical protein
MCEIKYPKVVVKLVGEDGNAFSILGRISAAMRRSKIKPEEISKFRSEAMSGNYDNLLQTCCKWVTCK